MVVAIQVQPRKISEVTLRNTLKTLHMKPDEFCDRWYGHDKLPHEQKLAEWQVRGHRAKCVRLLSEVLKKKENTVDKWGARFEDMPKDYEAALAYADAIRVQLNAAPDELLKLFLEGKLP